MKTILVLAIIVCFAAAQQVLECPKDGRLLKCSSVEEPVCGVRQKHNKQKKETFANHCIACAIGKSDYTVARKCEDYPKNAEFCSPAENIAEVCNEIYEPHCGWFNWNIKCIAYPCAMTGENRCDACRKMHQVLYTTLGECPPVGSHP